MKDSKVYIAPDIEYIAFEISNEIATVIISDTDDTTHDAIIDWT